MYICIRMFMYIRTYAFIRVRVCVCVRVERVKEKGWVCGGAHG